MTQLLALDMPRNELEELNKASDLMAELVAGGYRATGRPFYNHLIGVASLTALETQDVKLISAALLHSSYEFGRFPGWLLPPMLNKRRKIVARYVGEETEQIVHSYYMADWRALLDPQKLPALSETERNLILLKLADMLEDFMEERGPIATHKNALWPFIKMDDPAAYIIGISTGIGAEKIASGFREVSTRSPQRIIERNRDRTYFHTPLRSVLPYFIKSTLQRRRT